MANQAAIFLYRDVGTDATMSASSTAAGFAPDNVANELRQIPWRSTGLSSQWIQWTTSGTNAPTCVAVFDHNLTAGATGLQVRSSTSPTFASGNTVLSAITYHAGILFATWAAGTAQLYHRLEFSDGSNPAGYIQIGRAMLGTYFQPVINFEIPFKRGYIDNGMLNVSMNDVEHGIIKPIRRTREFKFPVFTQAELNNWRDFYEYTGKIRPFAAILDTTNDPIRETIYGRFFKPIEDQAPYQGVDEIMVGIQEAV